MSLESRIEELTRAVEALTALMDRTIENAANRAVEKMQDSPKVEKSEGKEAAKLPTPDDLKAACLAAARAKPEDKAKIKDLLASYGAKVSADVPADKIAEVIGKIEAGEY